MVPVNFDFFHSKNSQSDTFSIHFSFFADTYHETITKFFLEIIILSFSFAMSFFVYGSVVNSYLFDINMYSKKTYGVYYDNM